ncbi:hypothetical protein LINPERPRIM_LOCUS7768 [Linum perenne]
MNSLISLFLIFYATTTATLVGGDVPYGQCDVGRNDVDMATVVDIKAILIGDLANVVPTKEHLHYCNKYESDGVTMFGFAECTRRSPTDLSYCINCLALVGDYLVANCNYTGVGHAWSMYSACYFKIGFTVEICPA